MAENVLEQLELMQQLQQLEGKRSLMQHHLSSESPRASWARPKPRVQQLLRESCELQKHIDEGLSVSTCISTRAVAAMVQPITTPADAIREVVVPSIDGFDKLIGNLKRDEVLTQLSPNFVRSIRLKANAASAPTSSGRSSMVVSHSEAAVSSSRKKQ